MRENVIEKFEGSFANWLGVEHAFSFWKGRVAMYAILQALGVGEDDEVILPGYTCVMDVNPIKYHGAKPVYVDIEPNTYNIDPELIEAKITPRTKVIIAQHTYGYPCEMDAIMDIASRHGIPVVEDCCLALGSTYKGKVCGTFGVAAYWSFQWNKPFTAGIGGMATTGDDELARKIKTYCDGKMIKPPLKASLMLSLQRMVYRSFIFPRTTAMIASLFRWMTKKGLVVGSSSVCEFEPTMAEDFFMAMSAGQARAGLRQMKKIEGNLVHRRRMRTIYDKLLTDAERKIPEVPEYMDPVLVRYPLRVADKQKAITEAPGHFVELGTWFECPLHPIETPMQMYDYHQGMCPVSEKACREVINLPMHLRANEATARRSVNFVLGIGQPD